MSKIVAKGPIDCRCIHSGCGNTESISLGDFTFEEVEKSEKNMGPEICHSCSLGFDCPYCNGDYQIMIEVWEYPIGAIETVTVECSDCELMESEEDIGRMIHIEE